MPVDIELEDDVAGVRQQASSLIGESFSARVLSFTPGEPRRMPMYSAIFNLTNTIIGSGTLTFPYIFAQSGLLPAFIVAGLIVVVTTHSVYLLVIASDNLGSGAVTSFEALGYRTLGHVGSVYGMATFIFGGVGTLSGYLIFIGKLASQVIGIELQESWKPILGIVVFVIFPLSIPRRINELRFASLVAVVAMIFVTGMILSFWGAIGHSIGAQDAEGKYVYTKVEIAQWSSTSIVSVNLLIGAFCVQNTCLPIYGELANRSPKKMVMAVLTSMFISGAIYFAIGLSGYALLGGNVHSNVLLDFDTTFQDTYPWTRTPCVIAKIMMTLLLALSFPLCLWPCRSAVCSLIMMCSPSSGSAAGGSDQASDTLFRMVTVGILSLVTLLGIMLPGVEIPLGLANSLAGGSMIFIMPGLFYLASFRNRSERYSANQWHAYVMIAIGVLVAILGFTLQMRNIISKAR